MNATQSINTSTTPARSQHNRLVQQTEKWVSQTFYGQMLRQMRKSPFHSNLLDGGRGGQAFNEMLDQRLADHMSHSAGQKLVQGIVRRIEKRQELKAGQARSAYDDLKSAASTGRLLDTGSIAPASASSATDNQRGGR